MRKIFIRKNAGLPRRQAGITLLLSIFIVAVLFAIAFSITDITLKEFELSTLGRESQKAFYAAETGFDCA
ncbi:hypothetical protein L0Y49_03135, partial [bacterium]|nr:hypothetical protein [bacterium]